MARDHRDTLPSSLVLQLSNHAFAFITFRAPFCPSEGVSSECKELWRRARRGGEFQTFETVFLAAGGGGFTLNGSHEYFQHPLRSLSSLGRFDSGSFT